MPEFLFDNRLYYNPVEFALSHIGGTWKMPLLWRLNDTEVMRYAELKKSLPRISHKMLTTQLRELEAHGLITRTVLPVVPPHVEYRITEKGRRAIPVIRAIREYGLSLMAEYGLTEPG